jgi:hypothetical protein
MRRTSESQFTSAFDQLQKQARELLAKLRNEIRSKETDLERLKKEESKLSALAGQRGNGTIASSNGAHRGGRINWNSILEQMPKQFRASDVRGVGGLKDKRSSEIFAAITRWIGAGAVKRKDRGLYERSK